MCIGKFIETSPALNCELCGGQGEGGGAIPPLLHRLINVSISKQTVSTNKIFHVDTVSANKFLDVDTVSTNMVKL